MDSDIQHSQGWGSTEAGGAGGTHWSLWDVSSLVLVLWGLCRASRIWSFPSWCRHLTRLNLEGNKPMWVLEPGTRTMADALLSTHVQH